MIILIPTQIRDVHALAVDLVLSSRGHNVYRWFTADFPCKQTITHNFTKDESALYISGTHIEFTNYMPDLIWLRRPSKPYLEEDVLCKSDYLFAEEECSYFYKYQWDSIDKNTTWVNPYHSHLKANNKILQLKVAKDCGFFIPDTIITNDPDSIKQFILKNKSHNKKTIYKTFRQHRWSTKNNKMARLQTSIVNINDIPSNYVMRMTPGIFQEYVNKKYEVRVNVFDDYDISVKIQSVVNGCEHIDWRYMNAAQRGLVRIVLPEKIREMCILFMKKFQIRFGCFDFIVDNYDNYIFLEVNEMGQFLWIELDNPEIPMLSTFCQFLENSLWNNSFKPKKDEIKLSTFLNRDFEKMLDKEESEHYYNFKEEKIDV